MDAYSHRGRTATRRSKGVRDPECFRSTALRDERGSGTPGQKFGSDWSRSGISPGKESGAQASFVRDEISHEEAVPKGDPQWARWPCVEERLESRIPTGSIKLVDPSHAQELGGAWRDAYSKLQL